jgi:hypothetical protein
MKIRTKILSLVLAIVIPSLAWATMTVTFGPYPVYKVNGVATNIFNLTTDMLSVNHTIAFGNGYMNAIDMKSTVLFINSDPSATQCVAHEFLLSVPSSSTIYLADMNPNENTTSYTVGNNAGIDVYCIGEYRWPANPANPNPAWIQSTNFLDGSFMQPAP